MTDVIITRKNNHIVAVSASGHTGYGESGEDIVCAGISTLIQSSLLGLLQVAGIAVKNSGEISECVNEGSITAEGKGKAFVGGIASVSIEAISYCLTSGEISVNADSAFVGGIAGKSEVYISRSFFGYSVYFCNAEHCISESKISVTVPEGNTACVGGIIGRIDEDYIDLSYSEGGTIVTERIYYGGGALNCYFAGEFVNDGNYCGNIVGACGANIYEVNSYTFNGVEYNNFSDNCYKENSKNAFGAVYTVDGGGEENFVSPVDDKGATATDGNISESEGYKEILEKLGR